jgi:flagellar biosynthetic protein FlhB
MSEDSEKTEEATPERRRRAREEGQFARARDTGAVAATIAIVLLLAALGPQFWEILCIFTKRCFSEGLAWRGTGIGYVGRELVGIVILSTVPVALVAAIFGIFAGIAEAGFQPNLDLASPKFERLDPIKRLGQMLSPKAALSSVSLSVLRVLAVGAVAYWVLKDEFGMLMRLSRTPVLAGAGQLFSVLLRLALWSTLALAVLSGIDYVTSWFRHESQIKMSQQEIKDEMKQQEGRPEVRARQRARARELLKRGIHKGVKEATVIVTNPTHIAIALRYRATEGAPTVTAKGFDDVAQYIKELASEFDVPVVENKPLARALAAQVKVGRVIPMDLYLAVAEILAFVYRTKKRGLKA